MADHVHVRLQKGFAVGEDGELLELSACRCGATFTRAYPVEDGEQE